MTYKVKIIKNCIDDLSSIDDLIMHGLIKPRENSVHEKSKTNVRVLVDAPPQVSIVCFESLCLVVGQNPTRHEPTIKIKDRTKGHRLFLQMVL